jgi:(R)-2-hydroxyacyl-CoA dehydratese activating ATPase
MSLFCGVDIGARSIEVVLFDGAQIVESGIADTGARPADAAESLFDRILASADSRRSDLAATVATGYGRNYFKLADRVVSEILAHARGVSFLFPSARTVIDIGGQDSKLIELDRDGRTTDFVMNDRCAAGTGRFIELTGQIVGVPVEQMGGFVEGHSGSVEISSMCAVFAESEIVGLLQSGVPVPSILNGVFRAVARRTVSMAGRAKVSPQIVFTGGVARNGGVVHAMRDELGMEVLVPPEPQITGALGAAILAAREKR